MSVLIRVSSTSPENQFLRGNAQLYVIATAASNPRSKMLQVSIGICELLA